jgi:GNAT superfamily N-acetyltransferase
VKLVSADQLPIEQLTAIYNEARIDYVVPMPMNVARLKAYIQNYDVDLSASVVAMEGRTPLGVCMLGLRPVGAWVTRLGVLPRSRRHGAGRAMMEWVIDQARARGAATVYLEVIFNNPPARALFDGLGFIPTRELLILRRPPAPSRLTPLLNYPIEWLDADEVLALAAMRPHRSSWVNQMESICNAGQVLGVQLCAPNGMRGWMSYRRAALYLERVIPQSSGGPAHEIAVTLLHHLHNRFPMIDTIVENIAVDNMHLQAFFEHGYVEAFRRVEMYLPMQPGAYVAAG